MADIDLDFLARQMERLLTEMQGMREEMGSIYAELNSMRAEMANMRDDMRSMRDEIRALSTTVLRMDGSVQSMRSLAQYLDCSPSNLQRCHRFLPARQTHPGSRPPAAARAEFLPQRCFLLRPVSHPRG